MLSNMLPFFHIYNFWDIINIDLLILNLITPLLAMLSSAEPSAPTHMFPKLLWLYIYFLLCSFPSFKMILLKPAPLTTLLGICLKVLFNLFSFFSEGLWNILVCKEVQVAIIYIYIFQKKVLQMHFQKCLLLIFVFSSWPKLHLQLPMRWWLHSSCRRGRRKYVSRLLQHLFSKHRDLEQNLKSLFTGAFLFLNYLCGR